jgi:hypothetical protein
MTTPGTQSFVTKFAINIVFIFFPVNFAALIFASRNQVRGISLDPNRTLDLIVSVPELKQAVAVDVDVSQGHLYWSDVTDGTISRVALNGSFRQTVIKGNGVLFKNYRNIFKI